MIDIPTAETMRKEVFEKEQHKKIEQLKEKIVKTLIELLSKQNIIDYTFYKNSDFRDVGEKKYLILCEEIKNAFKEKGYFVSEYKFSRHNKEKFYEIHIEY